MEQSAAREPRYVAILDLPGERLFCSDQYRDEWTFRFAYAETFRELHEATRIAEAHGGRVLPWADAHAFEAPDGPSAVLSHPPRISPAAWPTASDPAAQSATPA